MTFDKMQDYLLDLIHHSSGCILAQCEEPLDDADWDNRVAFFFVDTHHAAQRPQTLSQRLIVGVKYGRHEQIEAVVWAEKVEGQSIRPPVEAVVKCLRLPRHISGDWVAGQIVGLRKGQHTP